MSEAHHTHTVNEVKSAQWLTTTKQSTDSHTELILKKYKTRSVTLVNVYMCRLLARYWYGLQQPNRKALTENLYCQDLLHIIYK